MINLVKYKNYLRFVKNSQGIHGGFIDETCGDSLLWSGLASCIPGISVDLRAALVSDKGNWLRRPAYIGDCYPTLSKSQISRDMILGVLYSAYYNKDLQLSESIVKYAFKHFGIMGKGVLSRTLITLSLLSTAAWVSYKLGGRPRKWLRCIPYIGGNNVKGFEAHLQVLHLLLRKEMNTFDSKNYKSKYFSSHVVRNPDNALFLYACDYLALAEDALDNEKLFPVDRPPNSRDRKEFYLWQREKEKDWLPSDVKPAIRHAGLDYLFVSWLILTRYGGAIKPK